MPALERLRVRETDAHRDRSVWRVPPRRCLASGSCSWERPSCSVLLLHATLRRWGAVATEDLVTFSCQAQRGRAARIRSSARCARSAEMYAHVVVVDCQLLEFASVPERYAGKGRSLVTGAFEDFRPCRAAP